jgi:hypothetical protein
VRSATIATAALIVLAGAVVPAQRAAWTFDDTSAGRPPQGFVFADGQPGTPAAWQVARDGGNAVLAHAADARGGVAVAIAPGTPLDSASLSARLRFPEGPSVAGITWRHRDPQNYYSVALDLRAQSVRIYRVIAGNRTRLEDGDDLELDPAAWHTVKVEDSGGRMRVWIDGVPVVDGRDRSLPEPGAIGVWTNGEATAWFDDLQAEPLTESFRTNRRR